MRLTQHPEVRKADIPGSTIEKYARRLSDEGVIRNLWRRGTYKILQPDAYQKIESELPTDAVPHHPDTANTSTIIQGMALPVLALPAPPVPEDKQPVEDKIRAWAAEGKSRNDMARLIGGKRNTAYAKIREVLGPAQQQRKKGAAV
jgi:hypothetical protein